MVGNFLIRLHNSIKMLVKRVSKSLLHDLSLVINQLNQTDFTEKLELLSGSSIGQHTRHILEFYQCFFEGNTSGEVDYDSRQRNIRIETDIQFATDLMKQLNQLMEQLSDKSIILKFTNGDDSDFIASSVERELVYNVEHAIHHMAIIKIAIISKFPYVQLPPYFGVAPSTVKYQMQHNVHS